MLVMIEMIHLEVDEAQTLQVSSSHLLIEGVEVTHWLQVDDLLFTKTTSLTLKTCRMLTRSLTKRMGICEYRCH